MENEEEIRKSSEFKLPVLYLRALSHCAHSIFFFHQQRAVRRDKRLSFPSCPFFPF